MALEFSEIIPGPNLKEAQVSIDIDESIDNGCAVDPFPLELKDKHIVHQTNPVRHHRNIARRSVTEREVPGKIHVKAIQGNRQIKLTGPSVSNRLRLVKNDSVPLPVK